MLSTGTKNTNAEWAQDKMVAFLDKLTNEEREQVLSSLVVRRYKKSENVYQEGETPRYLICVLEGKVKVYRNGVGGRPQIVRILRPMQYFAYRAYFAHETYATSAAAFEPSILGLIPLETVESILTRNNALCLFFINELATDLGISDRRTVNLTQKHIRARLAESILYLKYLYGVEEDNVTLKISLSRADLASLSNMTTSNAIRTLSNFINEGLVKAEGQKIAVLQEEELKSISNHG